MRLEYATKLRDAVVSSIRAAFLRPRPYKPDSLRQERIAIWEGGLLNMKIVYALAKNLGCMTPPRCRGVIGRASVLAARLQTLINVLDHLLIQGERISLARE